MCGVRCGSGHPRRLRVRLHVRRFPLLPVVLGCVWLALPELVQTAEPPEPLGTLRVQLEAPSKVPYMASLQLSGHTIACPQPLSILTACLIQPVPAGPVEYEIHVGKAVSKGAITLPPGGATVGVVPWETSTAWWSTLGVEIVGLTGLAIFGGASLVYSSEGKPVPEWATVGGLVSIGIGVVALIVQETLKHRYPLIHVYPAPAPVSR